MDRATINLLYLYTERSMMKSNTHNYSHIYWNYAPFVCEDWEPLTQNLNINVCYL